MPRFNKPERRGGLSKFLDPAPLTLVRHPLTSQPFAGNVIPASMFSQAPVNWRDRFIPSPDFGPANLYVANFRAAYSSGNRPDRFDIREDHYFAPRNSRYARVGYRRSDPRALENGMQPELAGHRVRLRNGRLPATPSKADTRCALNSPMTSSTRGSAPAASPTGSPDSVAPVFWRGFPKPPGAPCRALAGIPAIYPPAQTGSHGCLPRVITYKDQNGYLLAMRILRRLPVLLGFLTLLAVATEYYKLPGTKRIDQDLYRSGKLLIQTRYFYHYTYGEEALLKYEGSGKFSGSKIIWNCGSTCDVKKLISD